MPSRPARTVAASVCGRSTATFGMSSRATPLRPLRSVYSTTTDGRGASKPVTVIFARPGLPSAFGMHDRDDAARIREAGAAREAAHHVEEMDAC